MRKSYPRAPKAVSQGAIVCGGFNVGSVGQPSTPRFFMMGSSTSLGMTPPAVNVQKENESAPDTNPEPKDKTGWYYSEIGGGWYKMGELLEKERKEAARAKKLAGEAP